MLLWAGTIACAAASTGGTVVISAADPQLQYVGRFADGASASTKLFDHPGSEIRARLQLSAAATATVSLAQRHSPVPPNPQGNTKNSGYEANAFVVFVDGVRQGAGRHNSTFVTTAEQKDGVTYDFPLTGAGGAPLAAGTHDVRVVKATEADWNGGSPAPNYVEFSGFKLAGTAAAAAAGGAAGAGADEDAAAAAMAAPLARALALPPLPARKIEFLGDSITAGFCNECKDGPALAGDHGQQYLASWDYQIGELLDAQVHTVAWSGLGMVHNCCGGNTTMPSIFGRTLATVNRDATWDWSGWIPDALVVNLGTNDGSTVLDPKYKYVETYEQLVMDAAAHYGPDLHVFLACGPMSETYCAPVQDVLAAVSAKGVKAHFLDQRGFLNGTFGPGCCGHPGIEVDTAMGQHGAAAIKDVLGW